MLWNGVDPRRFNHYVYFIESVGAGRGLVTLAKIKVKIGTIEIEYEGEPAFLSDGLPDLLEKMGSLSRNAEVSITSSGTEQPESSPFEETVVNNVKVIGQLSANSVAARLSVKSGADIIICALATLEVVEGKGGVTKKEIQSEMRKATSYFNANHISNYGKNLDTLIKAKRVNQLGSDNFALTASERKFVEAKIVGGE